MSYLDEILVYLVRYIEVYDIDEDISEADREGINLAKAQIKEVLKEELLFDVNVPLDDKAYAALEGKIDSL